MSVDIKPSGAIDIATPLIENVDAVPALPVVLIPICLYLLVFLD